MKTKKALIICGILVLVVAIAGGIYIFKREPVLTEEGKTDKFVTASPLDMDQIEAISKFRSCSGHDYSGKNINNEVETERSMKNYAAPMKEFENTTNQLKIFAPFDGVVINNSKGKLGDNLDISPTEAPGWLYELGHVDSLKDLAEGSTVKSGQLIGYYNGGGAFDLQFWYGGRNTVNTLNGKFDSIFSHMTPELEKQLEPYGLSSASLIVSKEARDADPCKSSGVKDMGSTIFAGDRDKDMVTLKHKGQSTSPTNGSGNNSANGECADTIPASQRPPGCK